MNEAIELAIKKGGYDYVGLSKEWTDCKLIHTEIKKKADGVILVYQKYLSTKDGKEYADERMLKASDKRVLDPLFWQALGKALDIDWLYLANSWWKVHIQPMGDSEEKFWKELINTHA